MRKRVKASVTVLYSFVLFLIISLVLVSVESARQQAAVSVLQGNLSLALDSLSGQYYAPLFDEFGIYGLYEQDLEQSLLGYLEGAADPSAWEAAPKGTAGFSFACTDISVSVENRYALPEAGGEMVRRQMTEAGAICGAEALTEEILEALGVLKEQETGLKLLEEKAAVEEKLSAMDVLILKLMTALDGVPTGKTGLICDDDGKFEPKYSFAKKLMTEDPTKPLSGIDSLGVYLCLEPAYVNIISYLEKEREWRRMSDDPEEGHRYLNPAHSEAYLFYIRGTRTKTAESLQLVQDIRVCQEEIKPMLTRYQELIAEYGDSIGTEWNTALTDTISVMKEYAGEVPGFYDFAAMEARLSENLQILERAVTAIEIYVENENPDEWEQRLTDVEEAFEGYSLEGLALRYQGMRRIKSGKESFFDAVKTLFVSGLTSGILNQANLSDRKLTGWNLPSRTIYADAFDLFEITETDTGSDSGGVSLWRIIRDLKLSQVSEFLRKSLEDFSEKALLVSYVRGNFSTFVNPAEQGVLSYQTEYILFGKNKDADNVRRAALSILGVRFLMNLVHTLTDSGKRAQALVTATEIFGAELPFLITTCQYVILIAWAVQNAKLEAAEILLGKKVPFLVTTGSFQVGYGEICLMDKTLRFQRAEAYEDADGASPKYDGYLLLFLLLSRERNIVYRSMDLMQEHIRTYYDPTFLLIDCYGGVSVSVRASLPAKYSAVMVPMTDGGGNRSLEVFGTFLY